MSNQQQYTEEQAARFITFCERVGVEIPNKSTFIEIFGLFLGEAWSMGRVEGGQAALDAIAQIPVGV